MSRSVLIALVASIQFASSSFWDRDFGTVSLHSSQPGAVNQSDAPSVPSLNDAYDASKTRAASVVNGPGDESPLLAQLTPQLDLGAFMRQKCAASQLRLDSSLVRLADKLPKDFRFFPEEPQLTLDRDFKHQFDVDFQIVRYHKSKCLLDFVVEAGGEKHEAKQIVDESTLKAKGIKKRLESFAQTKQELVKKLRQSCREQFGKGTGCPQAEMLVEAGLEMFSAQEALLAFRQNRSKKLGEIRDHVLEQLKTDISEARSVEGAVRGDLKPERVAR
jgi:hypothetical protein